MGKTCLGNNVEFLCGCRYDLEYTEVLKLYLIQLALIEHLIMKKCTACSKPSVYHVTILHEGDVKELHFCESHFHEYMSRPSDDTSDPTEAMEKDLFAGIPLEQETEEIEELQCPHCGITFSEFRKEGRFGCPQDYDVFREKLLPLFENIHNAIDHHGKIPKHAFEESDSQIQVIKLRRDLSDAVEKENYEDAAKIRDEISLLSNETPVPPTATAPEERDSKK